MSNINDNTKGNQGNLQHQGNPQDDHNPVRSPQSSPRRSREGTPHGSHANGNTQFENDEAVNEALQKLIAQQVNKALEAFVSQLTIAPTTPTPNDNTLENPRSGLANSGSGGIPTESRDGEPGSSVNIILLRVLREMQTEDKLIPKAHTLSGFDNSSVLTKGEVILTTVTKGVVTDTKFQVVDIEMAYNMILERPWIHDIDVVLSTLHQLQNPVVGTTTQTPTEQGRTDVETRPDVIQEPKENENIKTTIEELEAVILFAQWPKRKVYVGANLSQDMKDQLIDATEGHELLSFLDAYSEYNQIKIDPIDEEKTSFITDRGTYCYKVMPFGLKNASATYQRLVTKMFQEHLGKTMEVYIDDMLVKTQHSGDHISHLSDTFQILQKFNMKLNLEKCAFGVALGKFLGFLVSNRGI
ncbi:uncharacterized protein [Nicotiana sylvestris]|uniref:uncharacterized protein n=1 Tax=Nicotiana sylvestris TaxID=4096 RepID=UPI00388C5901